MMEEQNSWKGHTFTLMIFGGIVVLCAIFFVLGMLVGRMQGLKLATVTAEAASKPESTDPPRDARPELRLPEPAPVAAKPAASPPPKVTARIESAPAPAPHPGVSLQVGAWSKQVEAEKQVRDLKRKGFARAFIQPPAPADRGPLYRVQVPASDVGEADAVKQRLEAAGFKAIIKK